MKYLRTALGILSVTTLLGSISASATPITYTQSTTATGSLGGTPFTNALVTLSLVSDTTNVFAGGPLIINFVGTFSLNIAGFAPATFTQAGMEVIELPAFDLISIGNGSFGSVLATTDGAFGTYDLKSGIGPITGPNSPGINFPWATTAGSFIMTSASDVATFTATVPEPVTLSLFGAGLAGAVAMRRRKKQA
jgi:hypothetical protein